MKAESSDKLSELVLKCGCAGCSAADDAAGFGWQSSKCCMKQRFGSIFNSKLYSDITFVVGREPNMKKIPAHKLVLSVGSKVFEVMFTENWASEDNEIELPDTDPTAFLVLLRYLYTDEIVVTTNTVISVLNLARNHGILALERGCINFFTENLKPNNAIALLSQAVEFKEEQECNTCLEVIDKNTLEAISSNDFCKLDVRVLCLILRRDTLQIGEMELFEKVLRWAKAECVRKNLSDTPENLQAILEGPASLIRFPVMSAEDFTVKIALPGFLPQKQIVSLFLHFQGVPSPSCSFNSTPRTGPRKQVAICKPRSLDSKAGLTVDSDSLSDAPCSWRSENIAAQKSAKRSRGRKKTRSLRCEEFVVKRFSAIKNKWAYMSGADEIGFSSNRDVRLRGIGLYASKKAGETHRVHVKVTDAETNSSLCEVRMVNISDGAEETYEVLFDRSVSITASRTYIIWASIEGPPSLYGCGGSKGIATSLKNGKDVIITFSEVEDKKYRGCGRTDIEKGQIPELYFEF